MSIYVCLLKVLPSFRKIIVLLVAFAALSVSTFASSIYFVKDPTQNIKYQVDGNHPPFEFSSNGEVDGFGLDLGRMIFSAGNYNVSYSSDTWNNVYNKIKKGEIDICGLLAVTESRKKEILFTKPIVKTYRAVYAKKNIEITEIADLENYRVGIQKSDYSETILRNELGINDYFAFNDLDDAIQALRDGNIDAVFSNQEVTNYLLVKHQLSNEITPHIIDIYPVDLAFGVSKSRPELVGFMNEQINTLQKSGLYEQAYQKYFYRHSDYYKANQRKLMLYIGVFFALLILTGVISVNIIIKQLRRMVDKSISNLKKEHELLRTTLLSITDGVIAVNELGKITFMNHVAEQLTGFMEKDSINKPLDEVLNIIDTNQSARYEVPVKEVLDKGYPINFNSLNMLISQGGSQHLILGSASPIK
jgi:ABC-type amino acid transport substrate-binding protein